MNAPPEGIELVRQWIGKAEEDRISAEYLLTMPGEAPYSTVCFHAQQCVEKYLKALLVFLSIDFPRIHDLGEILDLLPREYRPSLTPAEEEQLNDFAALQRYPGDYEPVMRPTAEETVRIALRVRDEVRARFPSDILSG